MSESSEILKAIVKTRKDLGTLGKGDFNPHGGYKYVSIDKYYEHVAAAAAKNGLCWVLYQESLTMQPGIGKTGAIVVEYSLSMLHESGVAIKDFARASVVHPIQGAQTVGSAMSYADKMFMRQIFSVRTGEEDADATNPADLELDKPKKAEAKGKDDFALDDKPKALPQNDVQRVKEIFEKFLPEATTVEDLTKFWTENTDALDQIKKADPEAYKNVVEAFKVRKQQLKG